MRASRFIVALALPSATWAGCASDGYTRLYHTEEVAPSLTWNDLSTMDYMGPTIIDRGVNFCVYSERATRIELLVFDDPDSGLPTQQFPLAHNDDLWNIYVEGLGVGTHYGYIAWGPNWTYDPEWYPGSTRGFQADVDADGNRFNPNKLLFDPWAKAIHRDFDWSGGSPASGPSRYESTYAAAGKSVIVESNYVWSDHEAQWRAARENGELPGHDWNDEVIYEVHPKGFTKNPASGVPHPGTFEGVGEMALYLADLGVTAVELMPVHQKSTDGGYWGYNTLDFFAPNLGYSFSYQSTGKVDEVIDEFKHMVDVLHQHNIEVILDVVYNHTGEGGLWRQELYFETFGDQYAVNFDPKEVASIFSYRGLDNHAWYALTDDGAYYWNNTGVGNETRPNHIPMHRLILDSLHYMVEELHIDGFRFDLAGILGEPDQDYNGSIDPSLTVLQDIVDDPVLQQYHTRLIAEPWTAAGTGPGQGGFPTASDDSSYGWAEWNAHFRDWWRSFVNNDDFALNDTEGLDGGAVMTGSYDMFAWNGRKPYHSINFVTSHDGFTMYDLFSYDEKQNGCGLLNTICCTDPLSVWCDPTTGEDNNRSRDWGTDSEPTKRALMRDLFTAMLISHGTPMILGGDEWMRTQYGNNDAYSNWADNEWNWFRWGEWQSTTEVQRYRMHDFVSKLIRFRREHTYALSPGDWGAGMPYEWLNPQAQPMTDADWSGRALMIHYYDDGGWTGRNALVILINMNRDDQTFTLPSGSWVRRVDTQEYYDTPANSNEPDGWFSDHPDADPYISQNIDLDSTEPLNGNTYTAKGSSIVIFEQAP